MAGIIALIVQITCGDLRIVDTRCTDGDLKKKSVEKKRLGERTSTET